MIQIDNEIGGKTTFYQFFESCINVEDGLIIPIAIYRAPNSLILGNETPYIITNPDKNCLLLVNILYYNCQEGDRVYVLGETEKNKRSRDKDY